MPMARVPLLITSSYANIQKDSFLRASSKEGRGMGENWSETTCADLSDTLAQRFGDFNLRWDVRAVFLIIYSALFCLGIVFNGSVVMTVARTRRMRTGRHLFLVNLMLADLLLCLTAVPITPQYMLFKQWLLGRWMCRLVPLFTGLPVFVTSLSLTTIALDKYIHIWNSIRRPIRLRQAVPITIAIWILAVVINVPLLLSYDQVSGKHYVKDPTRLPHCGMFCDEVNWTSPTEKRIYGISVLFIQFLAPSLLIAYCYARILRKVAKDMICENSRFAASLSPRQRLHCIYKRRRVTYILIGMLATFVGCWLPLTAINIMRDFGLESQFIARQPYFWHLVAHMLAMTMVLWNPTLFFWLTRRRTSLNSYNQSTNVVTGQFHLTKLVARANRTVETSPRPRSYWSFERESTTADSPTVIRFDLSTKRGIFHQKRSTTLPTKADNDVTNATPPHRTASVPHNSLMRVTVEAELHDEPPSLANTAKLSRKEMKRLI